MADDRTRLLAHPWWVAALAVLVVNDAYLKALHPGPLTGKLSDVAGVVVLAWLLGAVTRRPARAAVLVSIGFLLLKTVPGVAELSAPVLGGVTRRDSTDLVALLALLPSVALQRRSLGPSAPAERLGEVLRVLVAVSAAMTAALAVGATSCGPEPGISEVRAQGGVLWADGAPGASTSQDWARSDDGGRTWTWAPLAPDAERATDEVCDRKLGCFRVSQDRTTVRHQAPGADAWTTSKSFTPEETQRIDDADNGCAGEGVRLEGVVLVAAAGGPEVVVGAGTQGVLHRTADGTWHRRGVFGVQPAPLSDTPASIGLLLVRWSLPIAVLGLAGLAWARTRSIARVLGVLALGVVGWVFLLVVGAIAEGVAEPSDLTRAIVALIITLALCTLLAIVARRPRPPAELPPQASDCGLPPPRQT